MKSNIRMGAWILLGVLLGSAQVAQAQVNVFVDPPTAMIRVGETIAVNITVDQVADLGGFQVDVSFDPAVINIASPVTINPDLNLVADNTIDNTNGMGTIASAKLPPALSGSNVVLATLQVTGVGRGTSPIDLSNVIVGSFDSEFPSVAVDGTVIVDQPPTANAGPDQNVTTGDLVTLDGSGSSDPDGDALTYNWTFFSKPGGSSATLSGATVNPTFTADVGGTYIVQLIVNDGLVDSGPDTVTIIANTPPMADAGPDQNDVTTGDLVTLDGSGSSDPDGDALTYNWTFSSKPGGSGATLSGSTTVGPTFTADVDGTYVVQLIVNDGLVDSGPDMATIIATTTPLPVADAGQAQTVLVGDTVHLDGSGSTDVDGDPLTFSWSFESQPAGSTATLSDPTAEMPTFVADQPGDYVVTLIVNDGLVDSKPDTVTIHADMPPVADAGPDQKVTTGDLVTLDGSDSTDVDGDSLNFSWSFVSRPDGSTATLSDPTAVMPTFVVDVFGEYVVQLIVNDGMFDSDPDMVTISGNARPMANAGPDQSASVGDTVHLDGSGSTDVDGDPLTYQWSLTTKPAGSTATLSDPTAVMPTFVVDVFGEYVVQLIVNDGMSDSDPDTVTIGNHPCPVADAGPDQYVEVGDTVQLDGSGSTDVDGDPLTYQWSLTTKPAGSTATLSDPTVVNPTFVADLPGMYIAQLIVNGGTDDCAPDTVMISGTTRPMADAGPDQFVALGDTVALDGSGSSDADGDPLTYQWALMTKPAGSAATLSDPNAEYPTFVADLIGMYVAQLIVNDGTLNSDPDTVVISGTTRPVADAGLDQTVAVGDTVALDGSGSSDADGDPLTYKWALMTKPAGSAATLSDPTAVNPTFVADLGGTYVAQLIVNDGTLNSNPDTATIVAGDQTHLEASVRITPRTLNAASKGESVNVMISFSSNAKVDDIDPSTVVLCVRCDGSDNVPGYMPIFGGALHIKFSRQSVEAISPNGNVTYTVKGLLNNGTPWAATDTINVIRKPGR